MSRSLLVGVGFLPCGSRLPSIVVSGVRCAVWCVVWCVVCCLWCGVWCGVVCGVGQVVMEPDVPVRMAGGRMYYKGGGGPWVYGLWGF